MSVRQHALPFAMPAGMRRPEPSTVAELLLRARALQGHSVAKLARAFGTELPATTRNAKGLVGQLVEAALGADPRAGPKPDFPQLAVELKTIPMSCEGQPLESTFCCSVTMQRSDQAVWETSRLRQRLQRVLWVPIIGARRAPWEARHFGGACLWEPSPEQWQVLRADWEDLIGALGTGHSVRAHNGTALQLRPKAKNSRVRVLAASDDGAARTLPVAFYLRPSFTAALLARPG